MATYPMFCYSPVQYWQLIQYSAILLFNTGNLSSILLSSCSILATYPIFCYPSVKILAEYQTFCYSPVQILATYPIFCNSPVQYWQSIQYFVIRLFNTGNLSNILLLSVQS
jgi:hypothetical protein